MKRVAKKPPRWADRVGDVHVRAFSLRSKKRAHLKDVSTCLEDASGNRFFACNQATEATAWACHHHSHSHLDDVAVSRPFHPVASDALVHLENHRATCHSLHPPDLGGFIVHDDDGWAAMEDVQEAEEAEEEDACSICGAAMVPYVSEDYHNYTCNKCGCIMTPETWYACSESCEYDVCLRWSCRLG